MRDDLRYPVAEDAERVIVGQMLIGGSTYTDIRERGLDKLLWVPSHQLIVAAIDELERRGAGVDLMLVVEELRRLGTLEAVGGPAAVCAFLDGIPRWVSLDTYETLLRDAEKKRRGLKAAQWISSTILDGEMFVEEVLEKGRALLLDEVVDRGALISSDQAMDAALMRLRREWAGDVVRLTTGFPGLDELIVGVEPGELVLLAGLRGEGKSTLALNLVKNILDAGPERVVLINSLEMPLDTLQRKQLALWAGVDFKKIRTGSFDFEERRAVLGAAERIASLKDNLCYLPPSVTTVEKMVRHARMLRTQKKRLDAIFVDYMQLVTPRNGRSGRAEQVQEVSRDLKLAALSLNVPIIALSGMSRKAAEENREPELSDLMYGGEADADQVWFVHNPRQGVMSERWLLVRKARIGEPGMVQLGFDPKRSWFYTPASAEEPRQPARVYEMQRWISEEQEFEEQEMDADSW